MTNSEQLSQILTPRAATLTLHASHNPAIERTAQRGDQLRPVTRLAGGFVEVSFDGGQWYAAESALEIWTLSAGGAQPQAGPAFFSRAALPPTQAVHQAQAQQPQPTARPAYQPPAAYPPQNGYQQPANQLPVYQQPYQPPSYPPQMVQPPPAPAYGVAYVGMANRPCFACGREWGAGRSCQFCRAVVGLPAGVTIASPGKRLGGYLMEGLLCVLTLGIGWLIWSLIVYSKGQTPAKQLLGMRVVNVQNGAAAGWGTMFLREFIVKFVVGVGISIVTFGFGLIIVFVADLWLVWDKDNQELWDKMLNTVVVDDPQKLLDPASR